MPEASINCFSAYHPYYKKKLRMTEFVYNPFFFRLLPKLLSLPDASFNCVVKFATYHLHYKDTIISNLTWTFVCAIDCFYFLYGWSNLFLCDWNNLSMACFFSYNNGSCTVEPGLVTKKEEPPRIFIYFSNLLQLSSLLLSLILLKMRSAMFEYILIFKCATISNWQLSSTLAAMIIKTDHEYYTLTKHLLKITFDFSWATQIVKLLADGNALIDKFQGLCHVKFNLQDIHLLSQIGYVICPANATNKMNIHLSLRRCNLVMRSLLSTKLYIIAHVFDIKKWHWRKYQIMQKKLHQHKYYKIGGTSKHKIGKYEKNKNKTSKHWHLATFTKGCHCRNIDKCDVEKYDVGFVITGLWWQAWLRMFVLTT